MPITAEELETVKDMLALTNRSVLITRRKDGGVQSSPMVHVSDDDGNILFTTRQTNVKVKNLQRDPYIAVTLITEKFLGAWMQVEGTAEITFQPENMDGLRDFFRRRGNAETDTDAFVQRMKDEGRCLIKVNATRVIIPPTRPPSRLSSATP